MNAPIASPGSRVLDVCVLGPLVVRNGPGDDVVSLGGPQQRKVLAALVTSPNEVLSYDRLVEVLWPDGNEPENARRSAISYVARLRAALGDGVIATTDVGYVLVSGRLTLDADRAVAMIDRARTMPPASAFEVLDVALRLWRGPVFGDLNGEWWARSFVSRFEELHLTALADRVDALSADGWNVHALTDAQALVEQHPLREQFVERAMRGLHACGQTPEALRVFQLHRSRLADATGLEPSVALSALERSLLDGKDAAPRPIDLGHPLRGYILQELVGEGSFGSVYRAHHPALDRDVAIKVIRADLADDRAFIGRFEAEAQLVARLEHPHIVPLYDFWRQPGGAFLVFRFLRGASAQHRLRRDGPFTIDAATQMLVEVGDALSAAHRIGVVHRDVKPANILFDEAGAAYLIDFGIAAPAGRDRTEGRQHVGGSAGSPQYASPEQLRDGVEDGRADQYALAATVWELLAGVTPFAADTAESLVATKLRTTLPSLDGVRDDVPAELSAVLSRAGALHPADRYPSVDVFVDAFVAAQRSAEAFGGTTTLAPDAALAVDPKETAPGPLRIAVNPYKGLRPFGEADAADFFGRANLVDQLRHSVERSEFTCVIGPSGSGKSSIVLAGLVPHLRASGALVVRLAPGRDPFHSLSAAFEQVATDSSSALVSPAALRRPGGIRDAVATLGSDGGAFSGRGGLAIVVDQFEELWTQVEPEVRRSFADELVLALSADRTRVVATIRADFFDRPLSDPTIGPLVADHAFVVPPMSASELHEVITAPAERVGVRLEAPLVSGLVAEMTNQPGALPLLSFTLAELFERRRGSIITLDLYEEVGGLAGSLSRQADELTEQVAAGDDAVVRRLFTRLVTPGEGSEDTRRRVPTRELAGVPTSVIDAFVARRLLTVDHDRVTREPTIEVAHEVLLRSWTRLRGWLTDERAWMRELRSLTTASAAWETGDRNEGDLYRGPRLAVAGDLASTRTDALTEGEQRFLAASQEHEAHEATEIHRRLAEERRQNRRLRRSLVGIAVLLLGALIAGSMALVQRRSATRARRVAEVQRAAATSSETKALISTLAGKSLALRSSERDLAALLAVEAWRRAPSADARSALFGTFTFDPGFLGYVKRPGLASTIGLAIPGTTDVLVGGYPQAAGPVGPRHWSGPVRIDALTLKVKGQLPAVSTDLVEDMTLAVSPNGRFAAQQMTEKGGLLRNAVFDLTTNKRVGPVIDARLLGYAGYAGLAVDNGGTRLVITSPVDATALIFDARSGERVALIPGPPDQPLDVVRVTATYAPNGRLFLGSLGDTLRVLNPDTFAVEQTITVPNHIGRDIQFSNDGSFMVIRGTFEDAASRLQTGSIARIEIPSGKVDWILDGKNYGYGDCDQFVFSEAHDRLWCGDYFGSITERFLANGGRTGRVRASQEGWVGHLAIIDTPSNAVLLAFGVNTGQFTRWAIDGGGLVQRVVARGHGLIGLVDGGFMMVGTPNGRAVPFNEDPQLWDPAHDRAIDDAPTFLLARTNGSRVAGIFADRSSGVYNPTTKKRVVLKQTPSSGQSSVPTPLAGSADGVVGAIGLTIGPQSGRIVLVDLRDGKQLREINVESQIYSVAVSPDHTRVYAAGPALGLSMFDATTGKLLAKSTNNRVGAVVTSRQGRLAVSDVSGNIALVDPKTLASIRELPGSRGLSSFMTFDASGSLLLIRGNDNTASIIDVDSAQRVGDTVAIDATDGIVGGVGLSSDATTLAVSNGTTGGVSLWDLRPDRWVAAACTLAGRNLTRDEWRTYLSKLGPYRATCPAHA